MSINDVEFTLMMILTMTLGLSILIYVGNWLLYTLKTPDAPLALAIYRRPLNRHNERRRHDVKTGIVCSLPIHQRGRAHELPWKE